MTVQENIMTVQELQIWVLSSVVGVFLLVLCIVFKRFLTKLDELIAAVGLLTLKVVEHKAEINTATKKNVDQDARLESHSKRIRNLEDFKTKNENP